MGKHKVSASAKCPYYKCEERHEIFCKGPKTEMAIHVAFAVPMEKRDWMDKYCKLVRGCEECPVKKMLDNI